MAHNTVLFSGTAPNTGVAPRITSEMWLCLLTTVVGLRACPWSKLRQSESFPKYLLNGRMSPDVSSWAPLGARLPTLGKTRVCRENEVHTYRSRGTAGGLTGSQCLGLSSLGSACPTATFELAKTLKYPSTKIHSSPQPKTSLLWILTLLKVRSPHLIREIILLRLHSCYVIIIIINISMAVYDL